MNESEGEMEDKGEEKGIETQTKQDDARGEREIER